MYTRMTDATTEIRSRYVCVSCLAETARYFFTFDNSINGMGAKGGGPNSELTFVISNLNFSQIILV